MINVACGYIADVSVNSVAKIIERVFITYAIWFFIGVFCYVKRERVIPRLKKLLIPLLVAYICVMMVDFPIPGYYSNVAVGILCPLITIGGYSLPAIRIKYDITYGIFLYHWIVLNIIVYFDLMNKLPLITCLALYVSVVIILAWLSWKYVGKVAARLLNRKFK